MFRALPRCDDSIVNSTKQATLETYEICARVKDAKDSSSHSSTNLALANGVGHFGFELLLPPMFLRVPDSFRLVPSWGGRIKRVHGVGWRGHRIKESSEREFEGHFERQFECQLDGQF